MEGDVDPRNGKGTIIVMMITTMQIANMMGEIVVAMMSTQHFALNVNVWIQINNLIPPQPLLQNL